VPAETTRGRVAVVPATFDPPTNGHLEMIRWAAQLFDEVVVAVSATTNKQTLFDAHERVELVRESVAELGLRNVRVRPYENQLTVELAREEGAVALVRGIRAVSDFDMELQMSHMNAQLAPGIVTVAMLASSENAFLSSTLVREVARLGADVSKWVPGAVAVRLRERYAGTAGTAARAASGPATIMDAEGGADRMGGFVAQDERVR
jgi:pantetheine-phosphate adenylyltransferase